MRTGLLRRAVSLALALALWAVPAGAALAGEDAPDPAEQILAGEKAWIKLNQGPEGEIYLNRTRAGEAGDVNPYFACQAARGLLAGDVSEDDLACAQRYLAWHTARFVEARGEISNYRLTDGLLISTGHRDSVDAYVAVYLSLMGDFSAAGGDIYAIPQVKTALFFASLKLWSLTEDGLTRVSEENRTAYFMDNAEVYEACRSMERMFGEEDPLGLGAVYRQIGDTVVAGVRERLWNEAEGRYEVGLRENGEPIPFPGWEDVYPGALAQLFGAICGLDAGDDERAAALYETFCGQFQWEQLQLGDTQFAWASLAYAAVVFGDRQRAETYLAAYSQRYGADRSYPFHSAEAGWAARACGLLLETRT